MRLRTRAGHVSHPRRSEILATIFPGLPVWANLCRAYGADVSHSESELRGTATQRRRGRRECKEPARRPSILPQAALRTSGATESRRRH
jgi:hypothetical protein